MGATAPARGLVADLRARAFERECVRLRPLGEAYVRRRFQGQLGDADAEDAVSEVLLRLHRQVEGGRAPKNLQAAFFTGVRNASIDILRSRSSRPTVGLEAVAEAAADESSPFERAESAEDAERLQEALGRMRGNYREAVVLRFGLGLTVPEIAEQMRISLPAAKKLVLRAIAQARARLEAIDEHEFCPEMRDAARRAVFDREAAGVLGAEEAKVLHSHFRHCGACRSFLAHLHEDLHELGGGLLVATGVGWHLGLVERLRRLVEGPGHVATALHDRARVASYRVTGGFSSSGDGPGAGALAGGAQKIAAVCTAGVAGAATCLASGVVGPGIGLGGGPGPHPMPKSPPAKVRKATDRSGGDAGHHLVGPVPVVESSASSVEESVVKTSSANAAKPKARGTAAHPKEDGGESAKASRKSSAEMTEAEFGFESGSGSGSSTGGEAVESSSSTSTAQSEPTTTSSTTSSSSSSTSSSSSSGGSSGSSGSGGADFGGFEK